MSDVKNVKCFDRRACLFATIETVADGILDCRAGALDFQACFGDIRFDDIMTVKAGCLICGVNGCCGMDFSFTNSTTGKLMKVPPNVADKYGQSCNPKKCNSTIACFWAWFLDLLS